MKHPASWLDSSGKAAPASRKTFLAGSRRRVANELVTGRDLRVVYGLKAAYATKSTRGARMFFAVAKRQQFCLALAFARPSMRRLDAPRAFALRVEDA
jgi:hypothetical protein